MHEFSIARVAFAVLLTLTGMAGCGRKQSPRVAVFPVSGRVLVNGRPAAGAEVYFYASQPIQGLATTPMARADADGQFRAATYGAQDGLPSGEFDLVVIWPKRSMVEGEEVSGDDQLGGRYGDFRRPVSHISVQDGPLELPPLDLKK